MERENKEMNARRLSLWFVIIIGIIIIGIVTCIAAVPYDSGVLAGANLSGNNQYGGQVVATNDYIFYAAKQGIFRQDRATGESQQVYEGSASFLNPYDGWLYFIEQGRIMRTAYYGGLTEPIGTSQGVTAMSVNGLWIYYTDEQGILYKIRSDGKKQCTLTDGTIPVKAFEAANRIILFTDGASIYRMKTDGSKQTVLVKGQNITRMLYTLDTLFYCDEGKVLQIKSVEAGRDDGTQYAGLEAAVFTYNTNADGRGQLFYVREQELRVRKLESVEDKKEEDLLLTSVPSITDLYAIGSDLYYHDAQGQLYHVTIGTSETTVEPVM